MPPKLGVVLPMAVPGDRVQWVIADLHLTDDGQDGGVPNFLAWLRTVPPGEDLWILGDLFEYWLGPAHLSSPGFAPVLEALRALDAQGSHVRVVPGNRDFLLDAAFEEATGVELFAEGVLLAWEGAHWLFLHGDELCTGDRSYQRMRRVLRSRPTRALFGALPQTLKRSLARRLRRASKSAVPKKDPAKIAMRPEAALECLEREEAQVLVCGHAHGFQDRELQGRLQWYVLDAFGAGSRDVLRLAPGQDPQFMASSGGAEGGA